MDFLDLVHPNQGVAVFSQWVRRARFGKHIRLTKLAAEIDLVLSNKRSRQAATLINEYFEIAGFNAIGLEREDLLIAYGKLVQLNKPRFILPFQAFQGPPAIPKPYDYPGRYIAWIVHKLATRYGWTRHYIFNLWAEEVFSYIQEILIAEHEEMDEKRSLTELGYSYDKATGKATFRPVPRPGWMVEEQKPKIYKVRKDMLPVGHIIKLGENDMVH